MNGTHGLSAWRWLLILEGIPSCLSSILVWFFLPDYPETAKWLDEDEKVLAIQRLEKEGSHGHGQNLTWAQAKETLVDWRLYAHYAVSFAISHMMDGYANEIGIFRHLNPLFKSLLVYTQYYSWSRI
jgi:hypothetical protein